MPAERLSMRKVREILRLKALRRTTREIACSLSLPKTTVSDHLLRAKAAGIAWPIPEDLDDAALEKRLFIPLEDHRPNRPPPDWRWVHGELHKKHVTLALLWEEYRHQHPDGYQYSQFCELYRRWLSTIEVWMRQEHRAGEKMFVDYSGDGIPWVDLKTGEVHEAALFVAVLGASNYTFVEATRTQQLSDWIQCQIHAFEFVEGVTQITVPDQPKTAVEKACRYDPDLNPAYAEMARHYGTSIIPARPRHPRDKAKVEVGVLLAQRWIIASLRHRTFYSPEEINQAIPEPLEKLNNRRMRKLGRTRYELFLQIDKPALLPLPERRYEFAEWKVSARLNMDYHVEFENNYYSAPFQFAHQQVDLRATKSTVEIFLHHKRIASHIRSWGKFTYSTLSEHMPKAHQKYLEWTPSRIVKWAQTVGPSTAKLVETIMTERAHPQQGYRACLGILRLSKSYSEERLEKACARALACRSHSYRSVASILKKNLESQPLPQVSQGVLPLHENLRGSNYFN